MMAKKARKVRIPKTLEEMKKSHAERFAEGQQALVNVLQVRMKWHEEELGQTEDGALKNVHEELLMRDFDTLDEVITKYAKAQKMFKRRHGIDIPDLQIEE
jgi:hypothetical protein